MNPLAAFFRTLAPWAWAVIAAVVLVLALLAAWFVTEPGRARQRAAEAELQGKLAGARTEAARDAVAIQDAASAEGAASEQLSRESADVIRQAPGADQRLDPDLNRAARQRLCLRDAYRHRPECVQLARGAEPPG